MHSTPKYLSILTALVVLLAACSSTTDSTTDSETGTGLDSSEIDEETVSDPATPAVPVADPDDTPTLPPTAPEETTTTTTVPEEDEVILCDAPAEAVRYVDVPLDDPDGGLNLRNNPGVESNVIGVFPRSSEVVATGECQTIGSTDWWQVVPGEGDNENGIGWVSSSFLSVNLIFNPGEGKAIEDTDNIGVGGETLDEMITKIAESYGFDEDLVITLIGEPFAADAIGGSVTYELTGLKDDASNGYKVEVDFIFDKNEDEGGEIESYTAAKITNYALCSRGVTEDGLCI